jgi:hypothetical protein
VGRAFPFRPGARRSRAVRRATPTSRCGGALPQRHHRHRDDGARFRVPLRRAAVGHENRSPARPAARSPPTGPVFRPGHMVDIRPTPRHVRSRLTAIRCASAATLSRCFAGTTHVSTP